MRRIGWFLVLLVAIGWLACEIRLPETPTASGARLDSWRRTRDGWEKATWLTSQIPSRRPALHPGVVGLLELLLSLTVLVAFSGHPSANAAGDRGSPGSRRKVPHHLGRRRQPAQGAGVPSTRHLAPRRIGFWARR